MHVRVPSVLYTVYIPARHFACPPRNSAKRPFSPCSCSVPLLVMVRVVVHYSVISDCFSPFTLAILLVCKGASSGTVWRHFAPVRDSFVRKVAVVWWSLFHCLVHGASRYLGFWALTVAVVRCMPSRVLICQWLQHTHKCLCWFVFTARLQFCGIGMIAVTLIWVYFRQ